MSGFPSLRLAVCLIVLIPGLAFAQQARDAERLPDELVARMAGGHLASAAAMRKKPDSPAWRAAEALVRMKDAAVPALARALQSDDRTIRLNAVFVLNWIGTPATLPPRIKSVSDPDPEVRAQAVAGLPAYKNAEARRAVLGALKDPDTSVRNAAIRAFQPRNDGPGNLVRFSIARALIPLLDDPGTQFAAAEVLGQLGMNIAARPLLKLLKVEDKHIRSEAVKALGRLKDKQVAMELAAALRDREPHVRMRAAWSLGEIGDLRTTPALVALLSDEESFVRAAVAVALGRTGDRRAVPSLIPLLEDSDERVRAAAAEALGQIGDARAVAPLGRLLVRGGREASAVARALGRLRDLRAIEPLTDYLLARGSSPEGCREAVDALAQIRHPDSVSALVKVILNTRDNLTGHHARRVLGDLVGAAFAYKPPETVAKWWELNRNDYLRPIPEKK